MGTPAVAPPIPPPLPRRKRRRRWPWFVLAALVLLAIPVALLLPRTGRELPAPWDITSDRFVEALVLGGGFDRPGGKTGFAIAYDLLAEAKRHALPFDVFVEEWTRRFDERGFIVERHRVGERGARGRARDPITHLLFLGGEQEDHAKLTTLEIRLILAHGGEAVADYAVRAVPNPRASR